MAVGQKQRIAASAPTPQHSESVRPLAANSYWRQIIAANTVRNYYLQM